jgi:hypothetical protein
MSTEFFRSFFLEALVFQSIEKTRAQNLRALRSSPKQGMLFQTQ